MFKCSKCGEGSTPNEKPVRVVTETRPKTYPFRRDANRFMKDGRWDTSDDKGGKGHEIVKETLIHKKCPETKPKVRRFYRRGKIT